MASFIDVAEAINAARLAANSNDITAPQVGVYGQLASALQDTLNYELGDWGKAQDAYGHILDGATVAEAIKEVK